MQSLFKKNKIDAGRAGAAASRARRAVDVTGATERSASRRAHVLLATGSTEWVPPGVAVDGERVLTSREALESQARARARSW